MHWVYLCVYYYICVSHVSAQETTTSFRAANRRHSGDFAVREANVEQAEMNKVTQGVNDVSLFALPAASRFHVLSAEHETSYQPTTYVLAVTWVLLITLNIIGVYYIFLWNRFAERHCRQHYAFNSLRTPYHSHAKRKGNKSELLHQTAATPAASTEKPSRVSNRSMAVVGVNQGGRKGERRETNVSKLHAKHEQRATDDMGNNTQLVPLLESKYAVDPTTGGNSVVRKDSRTHAVEMQTIHETKDRPLTPRQRHEAWVDEAILKHPRPNRVSEYVRHRMEETAVDEKLRAAKYMPQSVPEKENGRSGVEDQRQKSGASSAVEAEGSLLFLEEGSSASSLFND